MKKKYLYSAIATLALAALSLTVYVSAFSGTAAAAPAKVTLYHNPGCTCCLRYAEYLDDSGYDVEMLDTNGIAGINEQHGVPRQRSSCHTMLIGDYVVVGHVPADVVDKLLAEQPDIRGISLPGMPLGSPGMGGEKGEPFIIRSLSGEVYTAY